MAAALPTPTDCCNGCTPVSCSNTATGGNLVGWFKVKSLAEARAIPSAGQILIHLEINGNEIGGDGFSGDFTWDENLGDLDDGADVLRPDDNPYPASGAWKRKT